MPVAGAHEPAELQRLLEPWIAARLEVESVTIRDLVVPQASGFSNETFLFGVDWNTAAGDSESAELVLRSQPAEHNMFPNSDVLAQQFKTMAALGEHTDLPIAAMRWAESDPELLGQPFFVMDRLYGQVPTDNPPYLRESFVLDMSQEDRRVWHTNAVDAMISVSQVDWRPIGLDHLDQSGYGPLGPEQRRGYAHYYWEWAIGHMDHPVADPAWAWLDQNWPDDGDHIELCWGDARPGNLMFDHTDVVAIFDWEMASLGNGESDLGWWLFLEKFASVGMGVELPEGMLTRPEIIERWESTKGRAADHVDFYERLAAFQFMLLMVRLSAALDLGMEIDNPMTPLARELFEL